MENKFINITFICITILVLVALANNLTTQNVEAISSYNNLSNSNMILTLSENFKSIKLPKIVFMFFFLFIQFVVYFQVFCKQLPVSKIIKNITVFIILEIILILYMISINNVFLMIYITFIFCVIAKIYETVKKMKNFSNNINKSSKDLSEYNQITQEEVNSIIPNFNIDDFIIKACGMFYDIQMAYMDLNYEILMNLLTDELYNNYLNNIKELKSRNQKEFINNLVCTSAKLVSLKDENNKYEAKIILTIEYDYKLQDLETGQIVASSFFKLNPTYELTFIKYKSNVCSGCGAHIDYNKTDICEYCKSKIINKAPDWIMSKKEKISQR